MANSFDHNHSLGSRQRREPLFICHRERAYRWRRLRRTWRLAQRFVGVFAPWEPNAAANLSSNCQSLLDVTGSLFVTWSHWPTDLQRTAINTAWTMVGENARSVHHEVDKGERP